MNISNCSPFVLCLSTILTAHLVTTLILTASLLSYISASDVLLAAVTITAGTSTLVLAVIIAPALAPLLSTLQTTLALV